MSFLITATVKDQYFTYNRKSIDAKILKKKNN